VIAASPPKWFSDKSKWPIELPLKVKGGTQVKLHPIRKRAGMSTYAEMDWRGDRSRRGLKLRENKGRRERRKKREKVECECCHSFAPPVSSSRLLYLLPPHPSPLLLSESLCPSDLRSSPGRVLGLNTASNGSWVGSPNRRARVVLFNRLWLQRGGGGESRAWRGGRGRRREDEQWRAEERRGEEWRGERRDTGEGEKQ
jgi:hypothetical protein